ncbi:monooxygenase, flavin-binding [Phlyctema vagabunda]|uniref:Monooxygenase, flavin-binding n=1 Tax=Phlyctema vagabunda TaxID=108571 RepID=A0ABR4PBE9_9HELO
MDTNSSKMYGKKIRKNNDYVSQNNIAYYPVVIIGAGESGIAMGARLKEQLKFDQFRIFDRQSGIGGTWYINRYPGVACDVPAIFYSFSFCPNPRWTTFHPHGPEIVKYLQGVCEHYEIADKIQLNSDVKECRWLESEGLWELRVEHFVEGAGDLSTQDREREISNHGRDSIYVGKETIRAKVLVSAVGGLINPKPLPENVPGKEKFQGKIFHSARWNYDVELKGKDVIVVGTGCSAAQFVPRLTKDYSAKSVTQLMNSPPWVVPRAQPPFGEVLWEKYAPFFNTYVPGLNRFFRALIATGAEYDWRLFGSDPYHERERKKLEDSLIVHMKKTVPEKYWEILTPDYGVGCKRRIFDATWFPSLSDPNIELTTLPLTEISEKSVTLGPGRTYPDPKKANSKAPTHEVTIPADVIILANGFETTKWLHPLDVYGRDGKTLQERFDEQGGSSMYMGTAMDGFPNLFVIFGPNTATGHSSVILASENMVNQSLKFIKPILKGDVNTVEIKPVAQKEWTNDTQSALKKRVWHTGGCSSWYEDKSGWNSTVYPYTQIWFGLRCMFPTWSDWNIKYTRKGLAKKRAKDILKYLALVTMVAGAVLARKDGRSMLSIVGFLKSYVRMALLTGSVVLQTTASRV